MKESVVKHKHCPSQPKRQNRKRDENNLRNGINL